MNIHVYNFNSKRYEKNTKKETLGVEDSSYNKCGRTC